MTDSRLSAWPDSAGPSAGPSAAGTASAAGDFDYDVFFSYRHRPLDEKITGKTFNLLESYRLPKPLRDKGFQDIRRAFRDTEELPVSRILTESIDAALHSSNCLVVVCSTDTPSSEWIDREVGIFIELGRANRIYPLLISGDPERSFPPSLKRVPDILDRVMDIRPENGRDDGGRPGRRMMAKSGSEILKVVSAVTGCPYEELLREHQLRRNRRLITRGAAAAVTFLAVAAVALGLMRLAQNYRGSAALREQASMNMLYELTYELPARLTSVPDAYRHISGILERNTEDINAIVRLSQNREAVEFEEAANFEKLATARGVLGSYGDALQAEETAIGIYRNLAESGAEGAVEALASAHNNRGRLLNLAGRYPEAADAYDEAIALYAGATKPSLSELATFTTNAGANAAAAGDLSGAAAQYEKALALLQGADNSWVTMRAAANANYNYGVILYRVGSYSEAEARLKQAYDLYDSMLEQAASVSDPHSFIQTVSALALCLADEGRFDEADAYYARAIQTALAQATGAGSTEAAVQNLYDQLESRRNLAYLYNNRGLLLNMREDYKTADSYYTRASEVYSGICERTGAPSDTAVYAATMLNIGENAFKAGDYARSRKAFEEGLAAYRPVCEVLGSSDTAQYYAWLSYFELVHNRDPQAALEAGLRGYELQPYAVLVNINLSYALLYSGYEEDCDTLIRAVAALGEGQIQNIRLDLDAQERAGLCSDHIPAVRELLDEALADATAESGSLTF